MTDGIIHTKDKLIDDIKSQTKYIKTPDNKEKSKIKFDYVVQISKLPRPKSVATDYDNDSCNITISENDINALKPTTTTTDDGITTTTTDDGITTTTDDGTTTTDYGIKSKMQKHHNLEILFMVTTEGNFAIGLPAENEFYPDADEEQYYLDVSIRRRQTGILGFMGFRGGKKTRIRRQRKSKRSKKSRRRQRTR